jgi:hypothetical protein
LSLRSIRTAQKAIGVAEIVVGAGVLVIAVLSWRRAARGPAARRSRWLDRVERMGPATALGLAFVLNLRPKGLLLGAAAGLVIAGARQTGSDAVIVVAIYLVLASATVTVPIIATMVSPARMQPRLVVARDWLDHNGGHVTVVVLLMVGLVILGDGLTRL